MVRLRIPIFFLVMLCATDTCRLAQAQRIVAGRSEVEWLAHYIHNWFASQGVPPIETDSALSHAATEHSRAVAEFPDEVPSESSAYLTHLLGDHAIRDAVVSSITVRYRHRSAVAEPLVPFLKKMRSGNYTHFGFGIAHDQTKTSEIVATIVAVRRSVEIQRLRELRPGLLQMCGRLLQGTDPYLFATTPSGHVIHRAGKILFSDDLQSTPSRFCATLELSLEGRYQLEIMVNGPYGPEVAALFPWYFRTDAPRIPQHKLYPTSTPTTALTTERSALRQRLFTLLNRSRRNAGLKPLRYDPRLERLAQQHSRDMAQNGFFGHRSPDHGDFAERLRRTIDVSEEQARENLVIATNAEKAHDSLLASPSHRQSMLDGAMTHIGIGIEKGIGRDLFYITQCFASFDDGDNKLQVRPFIKSR